MNTSCREALKDDSPPFLTSSANLNLERPETVHARAVEWGFEQSESSWR